MADFAQLFAQGEQQSLRERAAAEDAQYKELQHRRIMAELVKNNQKLTPTEFRLLANIENLEPPDLERLYSGVAERAPDLMPTFVAHGLNARFAKQKREQSPLDGLITPEMQAALSQIAGGDIGPSNVNLPASSYNAALTAGAREANENPPKPTREQPSGTMSADEANEFLAQEGITTRFREGTYVPNSVVTATLRKKGGGDDETKGMEKDLEQYYTTRGYNAEFEIKPAEITARARYAAKIAAKRIAAGEDYDTVRDETDPFVTKKEDRKFPRRDQKRLIDLSEIPQGATTGSGQASAPAPLETGPNKEVTRQAPTVETIFAAMKRKRPDLVLTPELRAKIEAKLGAR